MYGERAHRRYGLAAINQLMHAVQSGALARAADLPPTLVVAALLHDIGHMVHTLGEHPAAAGIDDRHEDMGARWLARHFGPAVTEPVRLHVAAKRYLCATEPGYFASLSFDSVESLELQGGPMTDTETADFERQRYWRDAVALRRIDEQAKDPNGPLPPFAEFRKDIEQALALSPSR
ncbi:MAG: HD domain-containing protein [Burkholderiales bacterium]|nr:HD domain-containing protein [Burkholderiales bacterium]